MMIVPIATVNVARATKRYSIIACIYPVEFIDLSRFQATDAPKSIVVDCLGLTPDQLNQLKIARKDGASIEICVLDRTNRLQVKQAQELECSRLVDRTDSITVLISYLRDVFGDYSRPSSSATLPAELRQTFSAACTTLRNLHAAALSGSALPVNKLTECAEDITRSIDNHGLQAWLDAVQTHHSHTYSHTLMVTAHALSFSKVLGYSTERQALIGLAGLLHDLGKIKIPLTILDKPGKPTQGEWLLIKRHPEFSRDILSKQKTIPRDAVNMAVWHHEHLDGTGYPDGLKGDQIPSIVRMLTIVDIYAALTEKRSYKESLSPRQALAVMTEMSGKLDDKMLSEFRRSILHSEFGRVNRRQKRNLV